MTVKDSIADPMKTKYVKQLAANEKAENSIADSMEAKYAKRLAANEKQIRDEAFNEVKSYLIKKSLESNGGFTKDEMLRVWKGLFYCLWMSDMPLIQEELAKNIAEVLPLLHGMQTGMLYFETFVTTMEREWHGIDRLRMDKFYLLIRFMLHQTFILLKKHAWNTGIMDWYDKLLKDGPASPWSPNPTFSTGSPLGLRLHFIDIFVEELTKFGHNLLKPEQITNLLQPYCQQICETKVLALRQRAMDNIFQELIDQSDAVAAAVADVAEMNDMERLNCDYAGIANSLIDIMHDRKVCRPNRDFVTKLVKKLKNVAEGHIPLNIVPDFGGENLDDISDLKKAEKELVKRLSKQMDDDLRKRKIEKKQYLKDLKKLRRKDSELPFSNPDLRKDVDFDRITNMRVEGEEDDSLSFGEKMKQKRKAKSKKNKPEVKQIADVKPKKNSKLDLNSMKGDLIAKPAEKEKIVNINVAKESRKRKSRIEKLQELDEESATETDQEPFIKKRKMGNTQLMPMEDIELVSKFAKKKMQSQRAQRVKNNKMLLNKLLVDESKPKKKSVKKTSLLATSPSPKNSEEQQLPTPKTSDAKTQKIAKILGTDMMQAEIVKRAIEASKPKKLRKPPTLKDLEELSPKSTPKRVKFQMSKNLVQRFRKNDKSLVLSPSPSSLAFDPNRTPEFGLLKKTKSVLKKEKYSKKKRLRASDFF